jgi:hemoglobin
MQIPLKTTPTPPPPSLNPALAHRPRALLFSWLITLLLSAVMGCGGGKIRAKNEDFFTSGDREADQRASQKMAKDEQLAGSGASAEKDVKKAKPNDGAGNGQPAKAESKQPLFERLGGDSGLHAIVTDFTSRALQDPRINWSRKGIKRSFLRKDESPMWNPTPENIARLQRHIVQFLTLVTGGPPQYDGQEIKSTHDGMRISNPEFDATIGDLKASLDKLQIPNKEQKELLAIVESTRPQIVTER